MEYGGEELGLKSQIGVKFEIRKCQKGAKWVFLNFVSKVRYEKDNKLNKYPCLILNIEWYYILPVCDIVVQTLLLFTYCCIVFFK